MTRWWAVMTAFVVGSWSYAIPVMHWHNVDEWPARILMAAFVLWLAHDPKAA